MRLVYVLTAVLIFGTLTLPASAQQRIPVTIASVPSVPSASTYLALDKGYFRDAGLDVTVERIDSLSKAVAMVATNRIQVAQGGISAGYFNAVAKGLPIIMALEGGSTPLYHQILVHPDLKDKIKTPADLKGRRVAISAPGSNGVYEIGMMLASAGLRIKDIDIRYISFSQMAYCARQRRGRRGADGGAVHRRRGRAEDRSSLDQPGAIRRSAADDQPRLRRQRRLDAAAPRRGAPAVRRAGARRPRLLPSLSSRAQSRRGHRYADQQQDRDRPRHDRPDAVAGPQSERHVQRARAC